MIRLVLADDHVVLRHALAEVLRSNGKYEILAEAENGEELLKLLLQHKPDLVIMDMAMPVLDGISTLERMKVSGSTQLPPVLVLSADEGKKNVVAALNAGARGFIPKNARIDELEFAIDSVLQGKTYLSPSVTGGLMEGGSVENNLQNPLSVLTERELEVLKLLADGKPNRAIGKLLHISTRTVDTHRSNILKKLNVKTNAELVKIAIAHRLINV
jgi:DNA-binding NarL/FixJ family response regulator